MRPLAAWTQKDFDREGRTAPSWGGRMILALAVLAAINVVPVSTVAQLQSAVASISSNTTIVIAPGAYNLSAPLYINGSFENVAIRGATGNRDDVVLIGKGMTGANDGGVP